MHLFKNDSLQKYIIFSLMIGIFIFSIYLQSTLFLNSDVNWLLEASKRMLDGGSYTKDYFENNPPWILYFYSPAVLIHQKLSISLTTCIRCYIYGLTSVSLFLSYTLLKSIISEKKLITLFITALASVFLIMPLYNFGQREHLLLILTTPYYLMIVQRIQNKSVNPWLSFSVGLLAGSVFILKPYFLITYFLIELYLMLNKKSAKSIIRPETGAIFLLLFIYAFIIIFRHSDYLSIVVPFSAKVCYLGSQRPFVLLLANPFTTICFITFLLFIITYEINRYKTLTTMMLLMMTGFLLSYFLQRVDYTYRILPAYSTAICLSIVLIYFYATTTNVQKYIHIGISLITVSTLYIAILCCTHLPIHVIFYCIITILLVLIGLNSVSKNSIKNLSNTISISSIVVLYLFSPLYYTYASYLTLQDIKMANQPLVNYLNANAKDQSIYFFTTNVAFIQPVLNSTINTNSAARFSVFWMLSGILKQQKSIQEKESDFFIHMVTDDIVKKQPKLIFIDTMDKKTMLSIDKEYAPMHYIQVYIPFEYLTFFEKDKQFRDVFSHYRYKTTLINFLSRAEKSKEIYYKFDVYEKEIN